MYDFEILVKSFLRFKDLQRLLGSIETHYPDITIRIADDSPTLKDCKGFPKEYLNRVVGDEIGFVKSIKNKSNVHFYKIPFDSGLSKGRNFLLGKCKTKYFVIMEDDFEVIEQSDLYKLERVIKSSDDIVIAGGATVEKKNPWHSGKFRHIGEMIVENGNLIKLKYGKSPPTEQVAGIRCIPCRYLQNFFMGNLELMNYHGIRWENRIKMWLEHGYFFYKIPKELKIYLVANVWINHYWSRPYCYKSFAQRKHMKQVLKEITGLNREPRLDRVVYDE